MHVALWRTAWIKLTLLMEKLSFHPFKLQLKGLQHNNLITVAALLYLIHLLLAPWLLFWKNI